jgi:hypothetical protein
LGCKRRQQAFWLIVVLWFFSWVAKDNDKLLGLSLICGFFLGLHNMTTN